MSNPYTPYFQRTDALLPKMEAGTLTDDERGEVVDLFRRALFFLANHLNAQAQLVPTLFLDPPTVEGEAEGADDSLLGEA